jgi:two-component system C4-dicarboxylate transport response regulator DctD
MHSNRRVRGARILVVEDDPAAARFTEYVLGTLHGYEVICVTDPVAALALIKDEAWDLVLADLDLPLMSGLQLLESTREVAPDLPFVLITASPTVELGTAALRLEADAFIEKPIRPGRLGEIVGDAIERGRRRRA